MSFPTAFGAGASALIFDLDGVIVDSTPVHVEAWERYLHPYGIPANGISAKMLGRHNHELVRDLFGSHLSQPEVVAHGRAKEALYRQLMTGRVSQFLVPGIASFLDRSSGIPLAVASNAERANVEFVLSEAGLRERFRVVVDGHQAARPKPFPDIYLQVARLLGVSLRDCVVFEDSPAGVQAARAAGARVVGLTTTLDRLPDVDLAVRDFCDPRLEAWLAGLSAARA